MVMKWMMEICFAITKRGGKDMFEDVDWDVVSYRVLLVLAVFVIFIAGTAAGGIVDSSVGLIQKVQMCSYTIKGEIDINTSMLPSILNDVEVNEISLTVPCWSVKNIRVMN